MNTFKKSITLMACLLLLIGTSGCDQVEKVQKAASELVTQALDEAKQAIGIESGKPKESESQSENKDDESGKKDYTEDSKEN
ncbi:MAG: hypothetical protein PF503_18330 [Desulfobacula sp.]|jgi:low affinity Fe/Cu permease|nr:hypothetical protein [Desulfobacula sp.]